MPLLELNAVSAGYDKTAVLHDIDVTLERGEIVTLIGANGAGKSTLVKCISGLLRPRSGTIRLDGKPIEALAPAARLGCGIAHVPEGRQVFSGMTVAENLSLGAYSLQSKAGLDQQYRFVCDLFPILRDRINDVAGNFSGGQQQMLAIARGLMSKPRILLLDEPSLGVAPILVAEIFALIRKLREQGITILLAEQNARQALSIADRGYVVENGVITMSGSGRDLLASPDIAGRYLGIGAAASVSSHENLRMAEQLRACCM